MNISISTQEYRELKRAAAALEKLLNEKLRHGKVVVNIDVQDGRGYVWPVFSHKDCHASFGRITLDECRRLKGAWIDFTLTRMLRNWGKAYFLEETQ